MNARVLELIKNPKIIVESDLNILESESEKMPYAQSIRALYLYGINLYQSENYKENLSKTAAYTTDKKILYQFINFQKNNQKNEGPVQQNTEQITENQTPNKKTTAENIIEKTLENSKEIEVASVVLNKFDIDKIIETENQENSEFIVVEGEKNRLLYEGEENFLEEKSQEIDLEATKESGIITVKDDLEVKENLIAYDDNRSEETISEKKEIDEVLETPVEKISENNNVDTQVQDEDSSGNISFNGIEDFLPQVKFSVPKNHLDYLNPPKKEIKTETNLPEEKPLQRSEYKEPEIAEIPETEVDNSQISFENTQNFEVSKPEEIITQTQESENITIEKEEIPEQPLSTWKPMSFSANTPDALIGKTTAAEKSKPEIIAEEKFVKPEVIDEKPEEKPQAAETERPVMNVSFFGNDVSKIEEKKEIPAILEKREVKETVDSNVGTFINTWQSWLKIDRPKPAESIEKTIVVKEKIIDQFIEKNPKISQLKDEVNFIVKEKKDDISHLMTETLAKLYVEQKLYSKAIKAYETLSEKHPQKTEYFKEKIEEIKEIRKS
ncbi:hypothetical protein [Epilithonimonas sp. UC225_85]|uniref:hypothetical protein n=1 Tax=Epilithonimonas sp. UC225_85 TaxID=3350167 RepID=UPI0036D3B043